MKKLKYVLLALVVTAGISLQAQDDKKVSPRKKPLVKKESSSKDVHVTDDKKAGESKDGAKGDTKMKTVRKPVKKTAGSGK